jgi:hypothetical protein
MPLIITDPALIAALVAVTEPQLELQGPDGQLLGRYTPEPRPGIMFPELGMTDEELDRLENNPNAKWHTADEVMARLRALQGDA